MNSDILTDIDFAEVYDFHCRHNAPATLVLTDSSQNSVIMDEKGCITRFLSPEESSSHGLSPLTFTGIQVMAPWILSLIPQNTPYHSIDLFRALIAQGTPPRAHVTKARWADMGTPERYQSAAMEEMAAKAFEDAFGTPALYPDPPGRRRVGPGLVSPLLPPGLTHLRRPRDFSGENPWGGQGLHRHRRASL